MLSLKSSMYEDDIEVIYRTDVPILFSLTVDGALTRKWKPWKMKHLELSQVIEIDDLIEIFSIINIDGSFLLMFDPTNIKLVLHEFIKLIKYIFN